MSVNTFFLLFATIQSHVKEKLWKSDFAHAVLNNYYSYYIREIRKKCWENSKDFLY